MNLYSWGANSHGQLGNGHVTEQEIVPTLIETENICLADIKSIRGGGGHTILLDTTGNIYSCGWNNRGQLGTGSIIDRNTFIHVETGGLKFKTVECGWDTSGGITTANEFYLWGTNYFENTREKYFTTPTRIELPNNEVPIDVKFGLRHGMVLTESGNVYLFGKLKFIDSAQLQAKKFGVNFEFHLLKLDWPPIRIASGQYHILIQIAANEVIAFGNNKHHQCGLDGSGSVIKFNTDSIVSIACGWTHSGVLCASGDAYLWGRNNYGQLGSIERDHGQTKLNVAEGIKSLHLGSEHGLAVTQTNRVCTWGWNEHGNCGNGTVENLLVPEYIALPRECRLAGVGAGFCYALCL